LTFQKDIFPAILSFVYEFGFRSNGKCRLFAAFYVVLQAGIPFILKFPPNKIMTQSIFRVMLVSHAFATVAAMKGELQKI
jgi:hypothetical protein